MGGRHRWRGKAKTVLQFLALLLMLWPPSWSGHQQLVVAGWWLFWPSLLLAVSSAVRLHQAPIKAASALKSGSVDGVLA